MNSNDLTEKQHWNGIDGIHFGKMFNFILYFSTEDPPPKRVEICNYIVQL